MTRVGKVLSGLGAALAILAVTSCSGGSQPAPSQVVQGDPTPVNPQACTAGARTEPAAPQAGAPADGSTAARLAERGRIIVGVSSDTLGLSARQNASGAIEGFEVDLARQIARHVTGDPGNVELKVVQAGNIAVALESGQVDMVINHVPVSCQYQDQVVLSEPYLTSPLAVVQREGNQDTGTCSDEEQTLAMADGDPQVLAPSPSGCLVWLQQGRTARIVGAQAAVAGLAQQDPQTQVTTTDEPVELSVAVAGDRSDLAGYVGAVINTWRDEGGWQQSWDRWLAPIISDTGGNP